MSRRGTPAIAAQSMTTSYERLSRRINAHIAEPHAQLEQRCTVRRLDTDCDDDWERVLDEMREVDIVEVTCRGDDVEFAWKNPELNG